MKKKKSTEISTTLWRPMELTDIQEVSLKKIIVEGYRAVGSLNDSCQSSNFLLAPFVVVVLY